MKSLSVGFAVGGLALGTGLIFWVGASAIIASVLSAGWAGFLALCLWQGAMFIALGLCWAAIAPPGAARPGLLIWGRMVRDAAGNCLPFSHIGGFVLGARALTLQDVAWPVAAAATVADVTAEFLAQIPFAALGLVILLRHQRDTAITGAVALGLLIVLAAAAALLALQRGAAPLFAWLGTRIAGDRLAMGAMPAQLAAIYAHPGRVALGIACHLLAWIGNGIGTWIGLGLLGADPGLGAALAIEALLNVLMSAAFPVPGQAGVQEAGLVGLAGVFGVPAELALGVSLLRRARDLAVGVPILLVWQGLEWRALRRARRVDRLGVSR